jgi:transcriptional regulator with XRE-family HTH domain
MNLSKTIKVNEATNEETRQEFGERIAMLLQQQKRSKAWLANKIGLSKQALNYLLNSSAKPKYVNEISAALEANPEWLRTGKGTFLILSNDDQGIRQIPLLNIEAIGKADQEKIKSLGTVTADQAYPSSCFAVKLENTSMEPTFNLKNHVVVTLWFFLLKHQDKFFLDNTIQMAMTFILNLWIPCTKILRMNL